MPPLLELKKEICSADNLVKVLAALGKLDTLITTLRAIEVFSLSELRAMNKKSLKNERINNRENHVAI